MFGRNKEKAVYQMKKVYNANELVIANLTRISDTVSDYGPLVKTTKQKYIFEIIEDVIPKYREVFTGIIFDTKYQYFNLPYVTNLMPFTELFPEKADMVFPKASLIWLQNDVNYPQQNEMQKPKTKEKTL